MTQLNWILNCMIIYIEWRPGLRSGLVSWFRLSCTDHCSLSPIHHEFRLEFVPYKNGLHLTTITHDKFFQLPSKSWWFSQGTLRLSPPENWPNNMTEKLLKLGLNPNQTNKFTLNDKIKVTCLKNASFKCTVKRLNL